MDRAAAQRAGLEERAAAAAAAQERSQRQLARLLTERDEVMASLRDLQAAFRAHQARNLAAIEELQAELAAKEAELQALGGGSGRAAGAAVPAAAAASSNSSDAPNAPHWLGPATLLPPPLLVGDAAGLPPPALCESPARGGRATEALRPRSPNVAPRGQLGGEHEARWYGCFAACSNFAEPCSPQPSALTPLIACCSLSPGWEPGYERKFLESVDVRSSRGVLERLNPANSRLLVERSDKAGAAGGVRLGSLSVSTYKRFSERAPR